MDRKDIYGMLEREIVLGQEGKGKAMSNSDGIWLSILVDYLGRATKRIFAGEGVNGLMLMKALAVGISWLADENEETNG